MRTATISPAPEATAGGSFLVSVFAGLTGESATTVGSGCTGARATADDAAAGAVAEFPLGEGETDPGVDEAGVTMGPVLEAAAVLVPGVVGVDTVDVGLTTGAEEEVDVDGAGGGVAVTAAPGAGTVLVATPDDAGDVDDTGGVGREALETGEFIADVTAGAGLDFGKFPAAAADWDA